MAIFSLCLHIAFLCLCSNLLILLGHQSNWLTVHSYDLTLPFVVQLLSRVRFFMTPWTVARQVSLSFTISWRFLKLMSLESVMSPNHLIPFHPVLLPSIVSSITVFSNQLALCIRWPEYWSPASVLPMNIQGWSPCSPRDSQESSPTFCKWEMRSSIVKISIPYCEWLS